MYGAWGDPMMVEELWFSIQIHTTWVYTVENGAMVPHGPFFLVVRVVRTAIRDVPVPEAWGLTDVLPAASAAPAGVAPGAKGPTPRPVAIVRHNTATNSTRFMVRPLPLDG